MRPFIFLLFIGAVSAGYIYRADIRTAWYQWQPASFSASSSGQQSFGDSLSGQFERFGRGIGSLGN